jgi:hypothetical protein
MNLVKLLALADALIWALALFLVFSIIRAAREGIWWSVRLIIVAVLGVIAAHICLIGAHRPDLDKLSVLGAGLGPVMVRPRSRYIPARVKRKVITDYERKTGKKYNSREVEIDHRWAFSRGGSNTADNLRVIGKAENRRKGKKKPRLKDWL